MDGRQRCGVPPRRSEHSLRSRRRPCHSVRSASRRRARRTSGASIPCAHRPRPRGSSQEHGNRPERPGTSRGRRTGDWFIECDGSPCLRQEASFRLSATIRNVSQSETEPTDRPRTGLPPRPCLQRCSWGTSRNGLAKLSPRSANAAIPAIFERSEHAARDGAGRPGGVGVRPRSAARSRVCRNFAAVPVPEEGLRLSIARTVSAALLLLDAGPEASAGARFRCEVASAAGGHSAGPRSVCRLRHLEMRQRSPEQGTRVSRCGPGPAGRVPGSNVVADGPSLGRVRVTASRRVGSSGAGSCVRDDLGARSATLDPTARPAATTEGPRPLCLIGRLHLR